MLLVPPGLLVQPGLPGLLAIPDCGGGGVPSRPVSGLLLVPPGLLVQPGLPELVGLVPVSQVFNLDPAFLSPGLGSCLLFFLEVAGLGLSLGFVPGSASMWGVIEGVGEGFFGVKGIIGIFGNF